MAMEKPQYEATPEGKIKKLTLPDGFRVGISNLGSILKEVADMKLTDTEAIKADLLDRVKTCNYVPSSSEYEYSAALFEEYQRNFGEPGAVKGLDKVETHVHSPG